MSIFFTMDVGNDSMRGHRVRRDARPGLVRADLLMPNSIAQSARSRPGDAISGTI